MFQGFQFKKKFVQNWLKSLPIFSKSKDVAQENDFINLLLHSCLIGGIKSTKLEALNVIKKNKGLVPFLSYIMFKEKEQVVCYEIVNVLCCINKSKVILFNLNFYSLINCKVHYISQDYPISGRRTLG